MTKINAAIVIQARMNSSRLRGKTMLVLQGQRMLYHVVSRLEHAPIKGPVIVATTDQPADDLICSFTGSAMISCFRGSEDDVLSRYWGAVKDLPVDYVVRATADNPLVWEDATEFLWNEMQTGNYDYLTIGSGLPAGMAVEMFTKDALQKAHEEASDPKHREHVTPYIYTKPDTFRCQQLTPPEEMLVDARLTVDTLDDFQLIELIYDRLYEKGQIIPAVDVVKLLKEEPRLARMNQHIQQKNYKE